MSPSPSSELVAPPTTLKAARGLAWSSSRSEYSLAFYRLRTPTLPLVMNVIFIPSAGSAIAEQTWNDEYYWCFMVCCVLLMNEFLHLASVS